MHYVHHSHSVCDTSSQEELLVEPISTDRGQVIPTWLKKQVFEKVLCAIDRRGFSRPQSPVDFHQGFVSGLRAIFIQCVLEHGALAHQFQDLSVSLNSYSSQKHGQRQLTCPIYPNPRNIIRVSFYFKPSSSIGDQSCRVDVLSVCIRFARVVCTRRTYKLANDDALSAIDDKSTGVCHQREVAHENLLLF